LVHFCTFVQKSPAAKGKSPLNTLGAKWGIPAPPCKLRSPLHSTAASTFESLGPEHGCFPVIEGRGPAISGGAQIAHCPAGVGRARPTFKGTMSLRRGKAPRTPGGGAGQSTLGHRISPGSQWKSMLGGLFASRSSTKERTTQEHQTAQYCGPRRRRRCVRVDVAGLLNGFGRRGSAKIVCQRKS
jgi:hypothetical protein